MSVSSEGLPTWAYACHGKKTKLQSLGSGSNIENTTVWGQQVENVTQFMYIGSVQNSDLKDLHSVRVNSSLSEYITTTSGVRQGCVLKTLMEGAWLHVDSVWLFQQ